MGEYVDLYTDGSCYPNPGPGGWACVLKSGTAERELSGSDEATTNNRMEITAAIMGLQALQQPSKVRVWSDSQYLTKSMSLGWLRKWVRKGKLNPSNPKTSSVPNADLWAKLHQLAHFHEITWFWIRGHAGHPLNERCDQLAQLAREDITSPNNAKTPINSTFQPKTVSF